MEPVLYWRREFGLQLSACGLEECLSLLKLPKLERRGVSGAQIVWEASENLTKMECAAPRKSGVWPSVAATVAKVGRCNKQIN